MPAYPKAWMNWVVVGTRVAALGSAALATLYFLIVYKTLKIPPDVDGMLPLIQPGCTVLVNTHPGRLERGDVVIYRPCRGIRLIGRVAGLPGEEVSLSAGRLFVNGRLADDYAYNTGVTTETGPVEMAPVRVMPGHLFVLNDNAGAKAPDSRSLGQVSAASVVGAVTLRF